MTLTQAFLASMLTAIAAASSGISLEPQTLVADQLGTLTFTLDQMCASTTTGLTSLTIDIPASAVTLFVEPVTGWQHHVTSTNVTFHGVLPYGHFKEFKLRVSLEGVAGDVVYFPAHQDCFGHGADIWWNKTGAEAERSPAEMAPYVTLKDANSSGATVSPAATTDDSNEAMFTVYPTADATEVPGPSQTPSVSSSVSSGGSATTTATATVMVTATTTVTVDATSEEKVEPTQTPTPTVDMSDAGQEKSSSASPEYTSGA